MANKAELQEQLAELQGQLAVAERKVEDLEAELGSVQAEVARLHEAREADQERVSEKMKAAEVAMELAVCREKERLRCSMEQAHARELEVCDDLKKAMEVLLQEREEEAEQLRYTIEELREVSNARGSVVKPAVDTMSGGGLEVVTVERSVSSGCRAESEESELGLGEETRGPGGTEAGVGMSTRSCSSIGGTGDGSVSGTRVNTGGVMGAGAREPSGETDGGVDATGTEVRDVPGDTAGGTETGVEPTSQGNTVKDSAGGSTEQGRAHARTGGGMKLPALPNFGADKLSDHEGEAYGRWLRKLTKHAELQGWSEREKLLQFELHLVGRAEQIYEVLPGESKSSYAKATKALEDRLKPAGRKALSSAQLLRRKQKPGEPVDEFVQAFENLFEKSYGNESGIDPAFRRTLKRDLFVQGLILKWQEKVLPTAENFTEALYQARTAEEQERQLAEIHKREALRPFPSRPQVGAPEKSGDDKAGGKPLVGGKPAWENAQKGQGPGNRRQLRCFKCYGLGHFSKDCPMRKAPPEARGSCSAVTEEEAAGSDMDSEFERLLNSYASVTSVTGGALGPLYYVTLTVSGSPVEALVDPGSSASIMSYALFEKIGPRAGIQAGDLRPADAVLRTYSRNQIAISGQVDLEFTWREKTIASPVYLRADKEDGEPLLLGTNVIVPLGLIQPAPGVEARVSKAKSSGGGTVRLVRAERIPRESGMLVKAQLEGVQGKVGPVVVEPGPMCEGLGLSMEEMVVEPDADGCVSVIVSNTSCQALSAEAGQEIGRVHSKK